MSSPKFSEEDFSHLKKFSHEETYSALKSMRQLAKGMVFAGAAVAALCVYIVARDFASSLFCFLGSLLALFATFWVVGGISTFLQSTDSDVANWKVYLLCSILPIILFVFISISDSHE